MMDYGARTGIDRAAALDIITSRVAIEQAASAETVVFDKKGALTVGEPAVAEVRCFRAWSGEEGGDEPLAFAVGVELLSSQALPRARERSSLPPASVVYQRCPPASARKRGVLAPRARWLAGVWHWGPAAFSAPRASRCRICTLRSERRQVRRGRALRTSPWMRRLRDFSYSRADSARKPSAPWSASEFLASGGS